MADKRTYYFGCLGEKGHYMHPHIRRGELPGVNYRVIEYIDGLYTPGGQIEQWKGKPDRPCPHCGKELSRDRNLCCRECGKEVEISEEQAQTLLNPPDDNEPKGMPLPTNDPLTNPQK